MKWLILILVNFMNVSNEIDLLNWNFSFNWNEWSNCSSLCGTGFMSRTRACLTCFNNSLILQTQSCISNASCKDNSTSSSFQSASITATLVNEQTLKPSTLKPSQSVLTQTLTVPDQTVKVLNSYIDGDHLFIWNITLKQPGNSLSSLNVLYDEFEITFDVYFNITDGTGNILLLQQNELPEETYLSIDYFNDEIVITQLIDTSKTKLILNAWNSVNISQQYINNAYSNKITINGNSLFFIDKIKPKIYFNLTLFACVSNCQLLEIKNLHISSRTKVFWSQWSEWSTCNELCVSTRTRNCSNNQWLNCTGNSSDLKSCDKLFCQAFWAQWSNWSECMPSCGQSVMIRGRVCNGTNCSGNSTEKTTCFSNITCIAFWTQWGKWSECMPSCGKSVMIRERVCNGTNCSGNSTEKITCFSNITCMEEWSMWSDCSTTCGEGNKTSYELKANNAKTRVEYCSLVNCPVDGMWSLWSNSWCSTTCGGGKIVYSRVCDNPIPAYHGDDCMGISNYTEDCEDSTICPVNGGWSSWSFWSLCNQPCEGGLMSRFRNCSNPTSQYGGLNCNGNSMETVNCSWKFCKKVDLNLEVYFVDEEYNDGYVRLTSDPTFELKERFIKAISKLYQNSKVVANFSVELHSIRNDVP
ncbi:hemicentin-1-like isoform X2 [Hydra vulgaris]|uniref:Hemicentin-1-like isoform X2 n=1 Tax=Hydra vulgaris TaxID=6087 RepID=A0ABM4BWJ7_HYDVU